MLARVHTFLAESCAPRDSWDDLATHHLGEGLYLGGVKGGGDGVKGAERGWGDLGLEVDHVQDRTDARVGSESLHHKICIGVLVGVGLVLDHGREECRQLVEGVALDSAPDLVDWIG